MGLIACLLVMAAVGVWELWKHSWLPPRWEDRIKGEWTGHSRVQSMVLTDDGGVLAAGFAPKHLAPSARVICYDVRTGAQRWEWSSSVEFEDDGSPVVVVGHATGIAKVRVQTRRNEKLTIRRVVRLDVRSGREIADVKETEPAEPMGDVGYLDSAGKAKIVTRRNLYPANRSVSALLAMAKRSPGELSLRGDDGAEYSMRVEEIPFTRSAFLQRLNQFLGDVTSGRTRTRHEVVVQRRASPEANVEWSWRQTLVVSPRDGDLLLRWDPSGALAIVTPRAGSLAVHQLEIIRLNPLNGRERPLPGTLIRSIRLPSGVRPVAVLCTNDGRTIAGGMAEDPTGDGWWIAGW